VTAGGRLGAGPYENRRQERRRGAVGASHDDLSKSTRKRALATLDASMLLLAIVLIALFAHPIGLVFLCFAALSFVLLVLSLGLIQLERVPSIVMLEVASAPILTALSAAMTLVTLQGLGADTAAADAIVPWLLATAYVVAGRAAFGWAAWSVPVVNVAEVIDLLAKRIFDLAVAGAMLVLTAPLTAAVAVAIWLEDRGPVLYRCERVGERGEKLEMLKFRKMRHGADGPPLTSADDDRFTRVGRFLARTKLDELPQLWNVLRGQMSLVGPRPEDPGFVAMYPAEYAKLARVRPGVTGLCQLAFAKEAQIIDDQDRVQVYAERFLPQKLAIDLLYARHRTFVLDLKIVFWTTVVLLRKDVAVHRQTGQLTLRRRHAPAESATRVA